MKGTTGHIQSKYLLYMIISMQIIYKIDWFLPEILMIKESCNKIGEEVQLATPNQKF